MEQRKSGTLIVKLEGGLGNQFYQYASAKAIARNRGSKFLVLSRMDSPNDSRRHNHLGLFKIRTPLVNRAKSFMLRLMFVNKWGLGKKLRKFAKKQGLSLVHDPENGFYPNILDGISGNILLLGYWQSYRYFEDIKEEIKEEFQLKESPSDSMNISFLKEIQDSESVALHIRRGDYVNDPYFLENFGTCSLSYYQNAIKYITDKVKDPHFYVFSDDPEWVKSNLKIDFPHTFVTHNLGKSDYEDFRLMHSCHHFIVANSSFSWWSAWLGSREDKIVICPDPWFAKDPMKLEDRVPNAWIKIKA